MELIYENIYSDNNLEYLALDTLVSRRDSVMLGSVAYMIKIANPTGQGGIDKFSRILDLTDRISRNLENVPGRGLQEPI